MSQSSSIHALILAGGSGERFWPLSRAEKPKHLLRLFSDKTLLEETVDRLVGFIPVEQIHVLTNEAQESAVRAVLPQLPPANILAEPAKRDTSAAIALGVGMISRRDPHATMIVLPADHVIRDHDVYHHDLHVAVAAAENSALVTLGIRPTWACPGFGYIEQGENVCLSETVVEPGKVRRVVRFREKPNTELAESFLRQGNFRWNAGMFVWKVQAILGELERQCPELGRFAAKVHTAEDPAAVIAAEFAGLPKLSIDYAVMENASNVLVAEAAFDWDDVGSWPAVAKYLHTDDKANSANGPLVAKQSGSNLVFSEDRSLVALIGVHDLIVVRAGDATLVCRKEDAEAIKQLMPELPPELK